VFVDAAPDAGAEGKAHAHLLPDTGPAEFRQCQSSPPGEFAPSENAAIRPAASQ
jgi:hypothetical protein